MALLRQVEPHLLADALHKMMGGMPDFFNGEPAILDFGQLSSQPVNIDWAGLISLFKRFRLQPMAVQNLAVSELIAGARKAGLSVIEGRAAIQTPPPPPAPVAAPAPAPAPVVEEEAAPAPLVSAGAAAMIIERPVRTGQQIYARDADLILLAGSSTGSELIADGNVHCYGPLRGRVIAGAQSGMAARIFTTNFGPEIVSIGGVYKTFEHGVPDSIAAKPVQVRLIAGEGEHKLGIEPLRLD